MYSKEPQVKVWLLYLEKKYQTQYRLYCEGKVMYRDGEHRAIWRAHEECADLHTGALFTDWVY